MGAKSKIWKDKTKLRLNGRIWPKDKVTLLATEAEDDFISCQMQNNRTLEIAWFSEEELDEVTVKDKTNNNRNR